MSTDRHKSRPSKTLPPDSTDFVLFRKMDSSEIKYGHKKEKAKIVSHYLMGRVLGEGILQCLNTD